MLERIRKRSRTGNQNTNDDDAHVDSYEQIPKTVEAVKDRLSEIFSGCSDFMHREISCGKKRSIRILVAYINGFVDKRVLNQDVIRPILDFFSNTELHEGSRIFEQLKECIVINNDIKEANDMRQAVDGIVSGEALLFIDGEDKALVIGVKAPQGRQVENPIRRHPSEVQGKALLKTCLQIRLLFERESKTRISSWK
jgi:spore germination protein KA